jgi:hypothetical protein
MAIAFTLIETAKLNGVDPKAWLTDVLIPVAGGGPNRTFVMKLSAAVLLIQN